MDNASNLFEKLDTFVFNYTEGESILNGYVVGKSLEDNRERFIGRVSLNPTDQESFSYLLSLPCSIEERTLLMDYRILTDEIVEVLQDAYQKGIIAGIRITPSNIPLSKEIFDRFNKREFYHFMIAVDSLSDEIKNRGNYLDIREQHGLCEIEHISYQNGEEEDHENIHITRKLTEEEIHNLVVLIRQHSYQKIIVDFYDPPYYKELLECLKKENITDQITITFLANPLYDELTCYEDLSKIVKNKIEIHYNTCNDLNSFYREEPHTEGVRYYSDIEASGITDSDNYQEMLKMFDEIIEYMEQKEYSPLEKMVYLTDYFKKNFIYDPDYENTLHAENANLDKVFRKDRMICEGFSNLYSAILRRAGILCFTYGTDDHQKNIVRLVDSKYGIDNLAIIDPTFDLDKENNRNVFKNFLIPIDSDLFANIQDEYGSTPVPSVIDIPTSLEMATEYYNAFIEESNPVYATDPIGYAIRMLQLMGLGDGKIPTTPEERVEFYKSALARTKLKDKIPYQKIAEAVEKVREKEGEYHSFAEKRKDRVELEENLKNRGYEHLFAPQICLLDKTPIEVPLYQPSVDVDFVEMKPQSMTLSRPRKQKENETNEEYSRYLLEFYDTMFYRKYEEAEDMSKPKEELEEYEIVEEKDKVQTPEVDEIVIYRDKDDINRTFVNEAVLRRFSLAIPPYKLVLDTKEEIYEIEESEAIFIIQHANNPYDPYTIRFQSFDFDNELHDTYEHMDNKKKTIDEVVIYRDVHDSGRAFVTEDVLKRFQLETPSRRVLLGESTVYEIDPIQAINIINNSNNSYAPYSIHYMNIEFDTEYYMPYDESISTVVEDPMPYNDRVSTVVEDPMPYNERVSTIVEDPMPYNESISTVEDESLIPGTNFKKPRARKPYETDEHYVAYLEGYYDSLFGEQETPEPVKVEKTPGKDYDKPRVRGNHETDDEYVDYLEEYYNSIFGEEEQEETRAPRRR